MTQDEIIEMAQECNLIGMRPHLDGIYSESLVAFANLVAAKEREACAKVVDELFADVPPYSAPDCAAAIRARGETSMTQEALKLALEFVKSINLGSRSASVEQQRQVITALEEALAQTQEPVVYQCPRCATSMQVDLTAKAALAQTQEPVQFKCTVIDDVHPNGIPLEQWTSPPQRTEQLKACVYCGQLVGKEKNT